ncbi:hypothetical protein BTS2_2789 [Bacillus sp. TS-2]|nr:hypothetical protein BTS2_2789 [Bacillus sp. TS-2]
MTEPVGLRLAALHYVERSFFTSSSFSGRKTILIMQKNIYWMEKSIWSEEKGQKRKLYLTEKTAGQGKRSKESLLFAWRKIGKR